MLAVRPLQDSKQALAMQLASKFHRLYSKYNPLYTSGRYGLSPPADVA